MRTPKLFVMLAGLLIAADRPAKQNGNKELTELNGRWLVVSTVVDGKKADNQPPARQVISITGSQYRDELYLGNKLETVDQCTIALDSIAKPKGIDLFQLDDKHKAKNLIKGIFERQGDTLTICLAGNDGRRPGEFSCRPGSQRCLMVLKREKASEGKPEGKSANPKCDQPKADREEEKYEKSIRELTEAIHLDPKSEMGYLARGVTYISGGEYEKAISDLSEAIRLNPMCACAFGNRGVAHARDGRLDAAITDLSRAIRIDPKDVNAYGNRGSVFARKGEFDKAIADLNEAICLNPALAYAFASRGHVYLKKHDYDMAIEDCTRAIRIDPSISDAYRTRAAAYRSIGNKVKAGEDDRTIQSLDK